MRFVYIAWLQAAWFLRRLLGVEAKGIGWMATKVRQPFDFSFAGIPFRFVPEAARSYCLLPAGIPNEPETHKFLATLLSIVSEPIIFIDVGASIGEFAVTMANQQQVRRVYAFEPHPASCAALRESILRGPSDKVEIIQKGVSSVAGCASFDFSERAPTAAGLRAGAGQVELCTLDEELEIAGGQPVVMLMDIEGGELDAMRGAQRLIRGHRPLIIFEYNATTRKSFQLADVQPLLQGYELFRLRSNDGLLDRDLIDTWNIVAVPKNSSWFGAIPTRQLLA